MLSEKEYLLLCELFSLDVPDIDKDSINTILKSLAQSGQFSNNAIVKEIIENGYLNIKLINSKILSATSVYIFKENSGDTCVVCVATKQLENILNEECLNELIEFVRNSITPGRCIVTGLRLGGIYAQYVVSKLDIEGIVFGAPSTYEFYGNFRNYILENEPVGEFAEKVIFIKQKTMEEYIDETYFETMEFDGDGKAVVAQQSEYSKFVSWFYNNESNIDKEVWRIFFPDIDDEDVLIENDLYSIFFKAEDLNPEGIENSLKKTIKYMENMICKNTENMKLAFDKKIFELENADFEERLCRFAEKATSKDVETVKRIYNSVETILMGIELFTLQKNLCDYSNLMEQFCISTDSILDKEEQQIVNFLEIEKQKYIDSLSDFPEIILG